MIIEGPLLKPAPKRTTRMSSLIILSDSPPAKRARVVNMPREDKPGPDKSAINAPKPSKSAVNSSEKPAKYSNDDLPAGCNNGSQWRGILIPTYAKWYGTLSTPWGTKPAIETKTLRWLWDATFDGTIPATFEEEGPIHYVSGQRMTEWRSGIASASLMSITSLVSMDPSCRTKEGLIAFGEFWLADKRYLFKDISADDKSGYTGMWQSHFILKVFAAHLHFIQGAIDVPELADHDFTPKGALALSAVSLHRAFTLITEGKLTFSVETTKPKQKKNSASGSSKPVWKAKIHAGETFSFARWGFETRHLLKAAKQIPPHVWDAIIADAQQYVKETSRKHASKSTESGESDTDDDGEEEDDEFTDLFNFR
ncbi:hypothetical protein BV22DRAFT_1135727 [Leucogyrophana mollusca]|uniref:Uncharacterized protein n=1 Tax=Leucogyrophana mollusca TaxID=85980 RepID=A0ACB8AWX4_9AGAM|nr:hypothetical protein BV22DRAFT_1135727 [Leucogyrophana mollusca]